MNKWECIQVGEFSEKYLPEICPGLRYNYINIGGTMDSRKETIDVLYAMPVSAFMNDEKCHLKNITPEGSDYGFIGLIDAVNEKWNVVSKLDGSTRSRPWKSWRMLAGGLTE